MTFLLQFYGRPEDIQIKTAIDDLLRQDPDGWSTSALNKDFELDHVFYQSGEMRKNLADFPEFLGMDTTYNVNCRSMHLTTIMVLDGDNKGRVAAQALIKSESTETLTKFLRTVQQTNPDSMEQVRAFIIDKSMSEFKAIEAVVPQAAVHLCNFHVTKTFRDKMNSYQWPPETYQEVEAIIYQLVYARSRDRYEAGCLDLREVRDIDDFIGYFQTYWETITPVWSQYNRQDVPNFGNRTTNHLESYHRVIKAVVGSTVSVAKCIKHIVTFTDKKGKMKREQQARARVSRAYNLNDITPISGLVYAAANRKTAPFLMDRHAFARNKQRLFSIVADNGEEKTVKYEDDTFTVRLTPDSCYCSCATFRGYKGLPCKHIFYLLVVNPDLEFQASWVPEKYRAPKSDPSTKGLRKGPKTVPSTAAGRYQEAQQACKLLSNSLVTQVNSDFLRYVNMIYRLVAAIEADEEVYLMTRDSPTQISQEEVGNVRHKLL